MVSSTLTTSLSQKNPLSRQIELGINAFFFVMVGLISVVFLLFLSYNNRNATQGYNLKNLQSERAALLEKNEILSMQISDMQSLEIMNNDAIIQAMVRADNPQYIRSDTAVAQVNTTPDS